MLPKVLKRFVGQAKELFVRHGGGIISMNRASQRFSNLKFASNFYIIN
jgi:hypothetical protein